jgi:hypothetical protein
MPDDQPVSRKSSFDILATAEFVYRRWPLVFLGVVLGALFAFALASIYPAPYRAQAVIVVDFNPELARPFSDMRQRFVFLDFQRRPLEALAFSDRVLNVTLESLQQVEASTRPLTRDDLLRKLTLPHPWEGEWHFVVEDGDPELAAEIANLWADAFIDSVENVLARAKARQAQLTASQEIVRQLAREQYRCEYASTVVASLDELEVDLQNRPADALGDVLVSWRLQEIAAWSGVWKVDALPVTQEVLVGEQLTYLTSLRGLIAEKVQQCPAALAELEEFVDQALVEIEVDSSGMGLSPYLEIGRIREAFPPRARTVQKGVWVFFGGLMGLFTSVLGLAFERLRREPAGARVE